MIATNFPFGGSDYNLFCFLGGLLLIFGGKGDYNYFFRGGGVTITNIWREGTAIKAHKH